MIDRAEYLANALSRLEPWRAQWYRRRRETGPRPPTLTLAEIETGPQRETGATVACGASPDETGAIVGLRRETGAEPSLIAHETSAAETISPRETSATRETGARPFVPPVARILSPAELEAARASVAAQYVAMAAEIEARRHWHKLPVPGWREGRLDIRSAMTGETTVVTLRTHKRDAA